jgi:hypothetical protein
MLAPLSTSSVERSGPCVNTSNAQFAEVIARAALMQVRFVNGFPIRQPPPLPFPLLFDQGSKSKDPVEERCKRDKLSSRKKTEASGPASQCARRLFAPKVPNLIRLCHRESSMGRLPTWEGGNDSITATASSTCRRPCRGGGKISNALGDHV